MGSCWLRLSHIFPGGRASRACEGWAHTEPLEQGRALISKLHHLKLQMKKKKELIKQQASLQVNQFSSSKMIGPCASGLGARPQRYRDAPDGLGAGMCQLWEGRMPAEARKAGEGWVGVCHSSWGALEEQEAVEEQLSAASCPAPSCGSAAAGTVPKIQQALHPSAIQQLPNQT